MTREAQSSNSVQAHQLARPTSGFVIWELFRHSGFVIRHSSTLLCIIAAPSLLAAGQADLTKLPPPATNQVDFAQDIKPIFEHSCLRCHGPERPKSRFRLDNREEALRGGEENRDDIVPGQSDKSKLVQYVARLVPDLEMPPKGKGDPLTASEVALLRAWIDQGAPWESTAPAAAQIVAAPKLGGVLVSGDRHMFREHYWTRENWNAGFEEFSIVDQLGANGKATLQGHALQDDYKVSLTLERRDFGFTRFGVEQYRKYFDDSGGYYPAFTPSVLSLGRDLHLDQGKAWIDFGLTLPDWPKLTVGYEYQSRQGEKSTLQWGFVNQGADQRNIYPATKSIDERVHIVKFDLEHDLAEFHIEDNFRGEFYDLKTERQNTRFFSLDDPSLLFQEKINESSTYFQGANALRVERSFTDWLFGSAGYLFSKLNSDAAFNIESLLPIDTPRSSHEIVLKQDTHALNVTGLLGPWEGLTFSAGVLSEWTHQEGFGSADQDVSFLGMPTTNLVLFDANQDKAMVEESAALRYNGVPFTSLFAEARLQQESIGQFEESMGGQTDFLRQTDASSQMRDFRFGFSTSPWQRVSFNGHYRLYEKESDYRHRRDELIVSGIDQNGAGYPAFIRGRDVDTDEVEGRVTVLPANWLKTVLTYKYLTTRYETTTDPVETDSISPGGTAPPAYYRAHFGSVNAVLTPWKRCYFSGTFSYQRSSIAAFANDQPQVVPYRGDIYSAVASVTFLLSKNTDFQTAYAFSRADYAQDNFADGLPVGMNYSRHAVTAGITHRLAKFLSARLQYGFYNYDEPSSGGFNNYSAHAVFGTLVFHLQ